MASAEDPGGGGAAAALAAASASALVASAARAAGDPGAAAQAEALRLRLVELAEEDAEAYRHALAALAGETGEQRVETRDFLLGRVLARAADAPLRIAEAAADVAELGLAVVERLEGAIKADAAAAVLLAAAAARIGVHLVSVNLTTQEGDERLTRARRAAEAAEAAAARVTSTA